MSICKRFSWVIGLVIFTSQAWGQVANSPFSQYGVGETYSNSLANSQGSAGLGVSLPQFWFINNQNPALLVYNGFASFQAGLLGEQKLISKADASEKFKGGNMNSLVLAFPAKHNKLRNIWGTSLGLTPYSSLRYKYQNLNTEIEGQGQSSKVTILYQGQGGLTQLYWSNGIRLTKEISVGLKAAYLFGNLNRSIVYQQATSQTTENISFMKGFKFDLGASYSKDSIGAKNYRFSAGAVYSLSNDLRTFLSEKLSQVAGVDTLSSQITQRKSGYSHLPPSITGGISFSRDGKWAIGTEFMYQDWSTYSTLKLDQNIFQSETPLGKSWRASFGGEFTPNIEAAEGVLKKMTYRIGVVSERYPYKPDGKNVNDLGLTFGFSVPTGRSSIDLGFKIGKRGNIAETKIQESYFKVSLGLTFNDIWFIKRKFD